MKAKKLLALGLSLTMIASMMTGCGSSSDSSSESSKQESSVSSAAEETASPEAESSEEVSEAASEAESSESSAEVSEEASEEASEESAESSEVSEEVSEEAVESSEVSETAESEDAAESSATEESSEAEVSETAADSSVAADTTESAEAADGAADEEAAAAAAAQAAQLAVTEPIEGSPWNDTQIIGNVPDEKPAADDDFYTYANYDFLEEHQEAAYSNIESTTDGSLALNIINYVGVQEEDSTLGGKVLTLFKQAVDDETQKTQEFSEIQPYLDMIDACQTLDELTAVLTSEDFPFNPMTTLVVTPYGMGSDSKNIVSIDTNLLFSDSVMYGSEPYQDFDINSDMSTWPALLTNYYGLESVYYVYMKGDKATQSDFNDVLAFEYTYGKNAYYSSMAGKIEYGTIGDYVSILSMDELEALAGNFPIKAILTKYGCDGSESYKVTCSDWLKQLGEMYTDENLTALKNLVSLKVFSEAANVLQFAKDKVTNASQGAEPTAFTDDQKVTVAYESLKGANFLGNEFGSLFVNEIEDKEYLEKLESMVTHIRDSYIKMVEACDWIDDTTRENILLKLNNLNMNILQPTEGYDDYSDLPVTSTADGGTLFSNYLAIKKYNWEKQTARIGKAADSRNCFYMIGAATVNCFYDPDTNSINILPGFINSVTYNSDMSEEEMYAKIGTVVGHEISHGFDIMGSQQDAYGLPNTIFSEADKSDYLEKVNKLNDYFSTISIAEGATLSGTTVSAEATADLCGVRVALTALEAEKTDVDYTKFFESYSDLWAGTVSYTTAQLLFAIDSHSPDFVRVNANCQMLDEFYDTYDVNEGDTMYVAEDDRLEFWW